MKIAIFFPGIGYHCDKPLLYYSRKIIEKLGYDKIITLSYSYDGGNIRGNEEKMKAAFEALYIQAEDALKEVDFGAYDDILFVSKSVGTIIASAYAHNYKISCSQILYTPLEYTFEYPHEKACAFIGTSDPWSDVDKVIDKAGLNDVPIYVYENLNHSLEGDNAIKNIEILNEVMVLTRSFLMEKSD